MYVIWTNNFLHLNLFVESASSDEVLSMKSFCIHDHMILTPMLYRPGREFPSLPDEVKRLVRWLDQGPMTSMWSGLAQWETSSTQLSLDTVYWLVTVGETGHQKNPEMPHQIVQRLGWGKGEGSAEFKGKCFKGLRRKRAEGHQVCTAEWTQGTVSCPWRLKVMKDTDRYVRKPFSRSPVFGLGT